MHRLARPDRPASRPARPRWRLSPLVGALLVSLVLAAAGPPVAFATTNATPTVDDRSWQRTHIPTPFGGLNAVTVEGAATVAVGFGIAAPFRFTALAATWDGERWDRQHVRVDDDPADVQLTGVDLLSPNRGWAVGRSLGADTDPVAARWNGSSWRAADTSAIVGDIGFAGVAALRRDDVWAAGQEQVGFSLKPALAHYDGDTWTPVVAPTLIDVGPYTALTAITVEGRDSIWAVGIGGVCLHYDGEAWSQVKLPKIDGHRAELEDVEAFGPDDVWAVGYAIGDDAEHPAALHWDGTEWLAMDVPLDPGAQLNAVAGTGTGAVAVGYEYTDVLQFYGLRLDADGPARPLDLPPGKDGLFGAATNEADTQLWVVGSGAVGDEGKIRPYAALRS